MKKILSAVLALLLLLLSSCGAKTEKENVASYYKNENLTEAEKFVNESKIFPDEYIGSFDTDSPLERREFATLLYKLAGEPEVEKDLKLIQTDESAFYYDACMFTACNEMTFDVKLDPTTKKLMTKAEMEAVSPTESMYIDDIKIPYAEVIYGLYNYAKYAELDCETKTGFNLIAHGGTREIDLLYTQCFEKQFESMAVFRNWFWDTVKDVNDCYAWAVNNDIIEADENGNYEIEEAITHGEFAEIIQRFYANVLNA